MRFPLLSSSLISTLLITFTQRASAGLIPELGEAASNVKHGLRSLLEKRCENPCGYYGQVCCAAGQVCYTDASNQAQCGAAANQIAPSAAYTPVTTVVAAGGYYSYYTSTFTRTDFKTVTMTYSSLISNPTQVVAVNCLFSQGQSQCGNQCCLSGQYCSNGLCMAVPGSSGHYSSQLFTITTTLTNTATAALRPTTQTILTLTSTGLIPFQTPTPASTTGAVLTGAQSSTSTLSGGAIAGIVIGVLLGIFLLILLCLCCCAKGLIDGFLNIFGSRSRSRRRTQEVEVIEERHHHGRRNTAAAGTAAAFASRWFGQKPSSPPTNEKRKKDSGLKTLLGAGAGLGALWALLGLKRQFGGDRKDEGSEYSYYYGSGSGSGSYSSSDGSSSDRDRDRRSRGNGRSRSRSRR